MTQHTPRPAVAGGKGRALPPAPLLTVQTVADVLGVSTRTVRRLVADGDLTPHRVGRSLRVSEEDLRAYLSRCRER